MKTLFPYIPLLLQGAFATLTTWFVASILSLTIGMILGIKGCRYLASPSTRLFIRIYTFITKGIPAYVQILIVYFVIPSLLKISISGFAAATIALAFCSSGYTTEIIRSSINNISPGQWDAARTLGYSLPNAHTHYHPPGNCTSIAGATG